ncbi:MAG: aminopeptidase, partial [Nocardioidaceae bacterium]|nr:aminopeptidase [Nocardioidaceae bacterium]
MTSASKNGVDPYVPGHGDASYDVQSYDVVLDYKIETNQLSGVATLSAVAREDLTRFSLDLHRLSVSKVTVDGSAPAKFTHQSGKIAIKTRTKIAAGQSFEIVVRYRGVPKPMPGLDGDAGWEELADGVIVASQPHGAPSWYPCNDRSSDKASYRFEVSTSSDYLVVANGRLVEKRQRSNGTTWVYEQPEPMASYLATVQIGRYVMAADTTVTPTIRTYSPLRDKEAAAHAFGRQREMMTVFTRLFGSYPFAEYAA